MVVLNNQRVLYDKRKIKDVGGEKLSSFTVGDALYQLFYLIFLVLIIVLIVLFIRSNKKRRNQLDRIEKKINDLEEQIKISLDIPQYTLKGVFVGDI